MRTYPDNEHDLKELKDLNVEDWQVEMLKLNPDYTCWGPYEGYMSGSGSKGWNSPSFYESWNEFGPWGLDELNEVVNFYFQVTRECKECESCEQLGVNAETLEIYKGWYGSLYGIPTWSDKLTQVEVDALWEAKRLYRFEEKPTPEEVNRAYLEAGGLFHDCINCGICVEARARQLGVWGKCTECGGRGHIYTKEEGQLNLILWFLHPRKGCSRGVEVKNLTQEDIPQVLAYLKEADSRSKSRFGKLYT